MCSNNAAGETFTHNRFKVLQNLNDNNASDECHMGFKITTQKSDSSAQVNRAQIHSKNVKNPVFIYLGFYVAFNTVQVISRRVVGRAEETST